ncbi:PIN domain-containing protein [Streptomyces sp. B21-079]|uniref:PIN domain-containing protein n=1 Tax=Streptomyces sp. B21-079 TaxID=3039409 RepID=UPI002FEF1DF4
MIVLDTNQLEHVAFPHGAVLGMLRKIAELQQQSLAIPEMVVVEHVAHYRHRLEQALTTARKALAALNKAFHQDLSSHIEELSVEAAVEKQYAALRGIFTILPTPPGAAEEALRREANRIAPAEQVWEVGNGKPIKARGARDVTIWLTLLQCARSTDIPVWFVSQDGDFGKEDFHAVLREEAERELGSDAGRLRLLHGGIDQLLRELAEPAQKPAALAMMLEGSVVAHAAHIALTEADVFARLLPRLPRDPNYAAIPYGSVALGSHDVKRTETYQVGDSLWVSAQLRWQAAANFERFMQPSAPRPTTPGIEFKFDATVLLEIENREARSAEVVSLGPFTDLAVKDGLDDRDGPWAMATWWVPRRPDEVSYPYRGVPG